MIDPKVWLEELFEFEDCEECERGAEGHTAVPLLGHWFARCNPIPDDSAPSLRLDDLTPWPGYAPEAQAYEIATR